MHEEEKIAHCSQQQGALRSQVSLNSITAQQRVEA
jgi:hypothetical protein